MKCETKPTEHITGYIANGVIEIAAANKNLIKIVWMLRILGEPMLTTGSWTIHPTRILFYPIDEKMHFLLLKAVVRSTWKMRCPHRNGGRMIARLGQRVGRPFNIIIALFSSLISVLHEVLTCKQATHIHLRQSSDKDEHLINTVSNTKPVCLSWQYHLR